MLQLPNLSRLASKNSRAPSAIEASGAPPPGMVQIEIMINTFLAYETAAYQVLKDVNENPGRLPNHFDLITGEFIPRLRELISDFYVRTGNYEELRAQIQGIANTLPTPDASVPSTGLPLNEMTNGEVAATRYISLRTRVYQLLNDVLRQVKTSRGVPTDFVPLENTPEFIPLEPGIQVLVNMARSNS